MCVLLLRHKNIRTCFFVCRVVYFSSSARRDRGGGHSPEGLKSCVSKPTPTHCVDTPYIFPAENTVGEKITVRDIKIAPTEMFRRGNACVKRYFLHYSITLAVAPLLRRAMYTPAGSVVVSIVAVVAPCRTACTATARPVAS